MRLILFFIFLLNINLAQAKRDGFHAYAAYGINYSPASFRLGYQDWEAGLLNRVLGFNKIFDVGSSYYTSFGFVLTDSAGVYSGVGAKFNLWFIPMRAELSAYFTGQSTGFASGLIGVTYGF